MNNAAKMVLLFNTSADPALAARLHASTCNMVNTASKRGMFRRVRLITDENLAPYSSVQETVDDLNERGYPVKKCKGGESPLLVRHEKTGCAFLKPCYCKRGTRNPPVTLSENEMNHVRYDVSGREIPMLGRGKLTKASALAEFRRDVMPGVPRGDEVWRDTEWNNFTDALCKAGRITSKQYESWVSPWG